ncbi:MAG: YdeI/OmpD-associated family protein [Candidatus Neomarinimicrobiota bacterium]
MKQLYFTTSGQWREWLADNHDKESVVWLIFHKTSARRPSLDYEKAVGEALCFGWIDSIIKNVDEITYVRKFTRRNEHSKWSEINKRRVAKLISEKRITPAGMKLVELAKANGNWDKSDRPPQVSSEIPAEFRAALVHNNLAMENFKSLAPGHQKQYIIWIALAKRPETKQKRIAESLQLLEKGEKLGLK